jgi:hypothetical protein
MTVVGLGFPGFKSNDNKPPAGRRWYSGQRPPEGLSAFAVLRGNGAVSLEKQTTLRATESR